MPPDRVDAQPPGPRVGLDLDAQAVDLAEMLGGEHLDGIAGRVDPPGVQQHEGVGDPGGMVEVVQHDADGNAVSSARSRTRSRVSI